MENELVQLKYKVKDMMEAGEFALLFSIINGDIAKSILQTEINQKETREELYMMSKGLILLEMKFREFANDLIKENE